MGLLLLPRKRRKLLSWVASAWATDVDKSFAFDPIFSSAFLASVLIPAKHLAFSILESVVDSETEWNFLSTSCLFRDLASIPNSKFHSQEPEVNPLTKRNTRYKYKYKSNDRKGST
ncbi:hypothetical protein VTN31DRAFT_820 [Thermomyces dupontii]|uniref:uncharacterized protein n=1 Tax=Talaromyces thermophilus TaxID=28565 RepID=UPI003743FB28